MKKNKSQIMLALVTLLALVFAFIQKSEAEKQREISIALQEKVTECEMRAQAAQEEAVTQRKLADINAVIAQAAREEASQKEK